MDEDRFRLRIRYQKAGRLKYLSHLETIRCLERCIRRAGLPFMVSQGFSPHMRTAFGWALPVGVAGLDEYVDVLISEYIEIPVVLSMFDGVMPLGMEILDAWYVDPRSKSLEETFPYSRYEFVIEACPVETAAGNQDLENEGSNGASSENGDFLERLENGLDVVLERGQMVVHRKKKDKIVVFDKLLCGKPELSYMQDGSVKMEMTTFTEGKGSLRPDLFVAEILREVPGARVRSISRVEQRSA